jgi:molecular chaperone GrpE
MNGTMTENPYDDVSQGAAEPVVEPGDGVVEPKAGAKAEAAAEAAATVPGTPGGAEPALAERLAQAEAQLAKLKDDYLRALAETENVRRRAQRDRQDASQYAITGFARDLLSVADNLRRALAAVDDGARADNPALDALIGGVEMTERELLTIFERYGVKKIESVGQPFDPHVHEAMFELPNPEVANGTILHVLEDGYRIHERTLRAARVGVAKGGPRPAPPAEAAGGDVAEGEAPLPLRATSGAYERAPEQGERATGARIDETL